MKSGYMYAADLWCEPCGEEICRRLVLDGEAPRAECACGWRGVSRVFGAEASTLGRIYVRCPACDEAVELDPGDYDSDDFPKGEIVDGEADSVQHCASGEECVNAEVVGVNHDGSPWKVGEWLENDLTDDGRRALVADILDCDEKSENRRGPQRDDTILRKWAEWYDIEWPSVDADTCDECGSVGDEQEHGTPCPAHAAVDSDCLDCESVIPRGHYDFDESVDHDAQTVTYTCNNPACRHVQRVWRA